MFVFCVCACIIYCLNFFFQNFFLFFFFFFFFFLNNFFGFQSDIFAVGLLTSYELKNFCGTYTVAQFKMIANMLHLFLYQFFWILIFYCRVILFISSSRSSLLPKPKLWKNFDLFICMVIFSMFIFFFFSISVDFYFCRQII